MAKLNVERALRKAESYERKGEMDEALQLYHSVLAVFPGNVRAKKGLAKLSQPKPDILAGKNPSDEILHQLVALYNKRQIRKVIQECDRLTKEFPQSFLLWNLLGAAHNAQGKLEEAIAAYNKAVLIKPDFAEAHTNRGNALKDLGRLDEAVANYGKAIQLKPDFAGAYYGRGNALKDLGQLEEAIQNYDKAIQLKPDFAEAYSNRGAALNVLSRVDEAVVSCDRAIQLKPDSAEAHFNRGIALKELGRFRLAMASCQKAVSINPHNGLFWAGYASSLKEVKFESYNDELGHYLLQVLEQPTVRPADVSVSVITALHHHPVISHTLALSKSDQFNEDIGHLTEQLSTVPLLLRVMELSSIADLDVEKMLTKIRKAMLHKAASGDVEALGIPFSAALALHCFTNEYVFSESEEEKQELELLQENVKVILENEVTVSPIWIAVLGAYRPLNSFSWANAFMEKTEWPDEIKKVIVRQVDNVRKEQALHSTIPSLASIDDKVSQLVRNQYEENPYPRWINTGFSDKPKTVSQVLQSVKPHLNFEVQQFSNNPDILVAGCGTGQHALSTASRFLGCNVLAIDLSLKSLSYAKRKTQELGITNIEYMQGDILKLDQLKREFDIIECAGVLHHMDDPLAGWKVLVGKLRTDGVMNIGLYSEIARQHIVEARRQIAKKDYISSPDSIRQYREEVIKLGLDSNSEVIKVLGSHDFYSLSTCRDLLFHVQEHRFTLPQIEEALNDLGLKFIGFELEQSWIRNEFRKLYPKEENALVSIPLWHQFELKNPNTFGGMYQFWVQKA